LVQTVEAFSGRLCDQIDLDALSTEAHPEVRHDRRRGPTEHESVPLASSTRLYSGTTPQRSVGRPSGWRVRVELKVAAFSVRERIGR